MSTIISRLEPVIQKEKPDLILVHGDTITTASGAIAGMLNKCPVMHMEAGARSIFKYNPFPEEMNRRITDVISDYHLCQAVPEIENLIKENVQSSYIVGNTAIDALKMLNEQKSISDIKNPKKILVTLHRRENWGDNCDKICEAVKQLSEYEITFVCHPNPIVKDKIAKLLEDCEHVKIKDALGYREFLDELSSAMLAITDSGGVTQEAPTLHTPVLITRDVCENKELLDNNLALIVGANTDAITLYARALIEDTSLWKTMTGKNPYGEGDAYKKIIKIIRGILK